MELPGEDRGGDPSPRPGMRERERERDTQMSWYSQFCQQRLSLTTKLRIYSLLGLLVLYECFLVVLRYFAVAFCCDDTSVIKKNHFWFPFSLLTFLQLLQFIQK